MGAFKDFLDQKAQAWLDLQNHPRRLEFEKAAGIPHAGRWTGSYEDGMKLLFKHFKRKWNTIPASTAELEIHFGKITWKTMEIGSKVTFRGGRFEGVRADVTIDGTNDRGVPIQFRYMQGYSGYSGYRYFRYNNSSLRLMTKLDHPGEADRQRSRFKQEEHDD